MEKKVYPLYLLDYGMYFKVRRSTYMFVQRLANGVVECRDKFGLLVEFSPDLAVVVL